MKAIESTPEVVQHIEYFYSLDWNGLHSSDFRAFFSTDIFFITAFEVYLENLTEIWPGLAKLADLNMPFLLYHKFGCHVLRILVKKLPTLCESIAEFALHRFAEASCFEFSCKVLQVVAQYNTKFRQKCLDNYFDLWNNLKKSVSSIYLLTSCLRYSSPDEKSFRQIGELLAKKATTLTKDKYDKRMLAKYVEFCSESELHTFFKILKYNTELLERFKDKYMVYIFRLLLRRGHKKSMEEMSRSVRENIEVLLEIKLFRQLVLEIIQEPESFQADFRKEIVDGIRAVPDRQLELHSELWASIEAVAH
jgi:hypothetical protein